MRDTNRSWAEQEGMVDDEKESSSSSSSSSKKEEPVIQDVENQQELIEQFQDFHCERMEKDK
eukprot:2202117-Karenia_brevis.AAC.1